MLTTQVTMGAKVKSFEKAFCTPFGHGNGVMSNSGSSANLLAIAALANPDASDALRPGDEVIGHVTRYCWSPRLKHNIALVNLPSALAVTGTALLLDAGDGWRDAEVVDIPWIPPEKVIPAF